ARCLLAPRTAAQLGPRLALHLRFEVTAVHCLQIRDDRMLGKSCTQCLDGSQALGENQRCARLQPVNSGLDTDRRCLERFIDRGQVERELDDRIAKCGEMYISGSGHLTPVPSRPPPEETYPPP